MADTAGYTIEGVQLKLGMLLKNNSTTGKLITVYDKTDTGSNVMATITPGNDIGTIVYFSGATDLIGREDTTAGWVAVTSAVISKAETYAQMITRILKATAITPLNLISQPIIFGWVKFTDLQAVNAGGGTLATQTAQIDQANNANPSIAAATTKLAAGVGNAVGAAAAGVVGGITGNLIWYILGAGLLWKAFNLKSASKKGGVTFK